MFVWLACGPVLATGPSSRIIEIKPVALNSELVLFRTRSETNGMGAHDYVLTRYGWLLVSASGVWREMEYRTLDPEAIAEPEREQLFDRYYQEFTRPFDWNHPPKSARDVIRQHHLHKFDQRRKEGQLATVGSKRLVTNCNGRECPMLRSVDGIKARLKPDLPLEVNFIHAGVMVLRNHNDGDMEGDGKNAGAWFDVPNVQDLNDGKGPQDYGFEYQSIDAIVLLPCNRGRQ